MPYQSANGGFRPIQFCELIASLETICHPDPTRRYVSRVIHKLYILSAPEPSSCGRSYSIFSITAAVYSSLFGSLKMLRIGLSNRTSLTPGCRVDTIVMNS